MNSEGAAIKLMAAPLLRLSGTNLRVVNPFNNQAK
jgi:hypothetical protein